MSPIRRYSIAAAFLAIGALIAGCGSSTPNSEAAFKATSSQHAEGWLPAGHKEAAQADIKGCTECHGTDYAGGIAQVSCTSCHLGGINAIHPQTWGQQASLTHGAYVTANGNSACSNAWCHGTDLTGVAESGPSCTSCHIGGSNSFHPADWGAYAYARHAVYVRANGSTTCTNIACHGTDLTGVAGSGPSCTSCHIGGVYSFHPVDWSSDITKHKDYVQSNGTRSCATAACHGTNLQGVTMSGPSCNTCH